MPVFMCALIGMRHFNKLIHMFISMVIKLITFQQMNQQINFEDWTWVRRKDRKSKDLAQFEDRLQPDWCF